MKALHHAVEMFIAEERVRVVVVEYFHIGVCVLWIIPLKSKLSSPVNYC